ncbi:hypothetical protein D3C78_1929040 [compost metagenome]
MGQNRSFLGRHNKTGLSDLHIQDLRRNRYCNPDLNIRHHNNRPVIALPVEPGPHPCNSNPDFDRLSV